VRDEAVPEERVGPMTGPIDELVRDERVPGNVLLAEAANRGGGKNRVAAERLEPPDVRPVVDFARGEPVPAPVPREEGDGDPGQGAREEGVGRRAERGVDGFLRDPVDRGEVVDAASADESDAPGQTRASSRLSR